MLLALVDIEVRAIFLLGLPAVAVDVPLGQFPKQAHPMADKTVKFPVFQLLIINYKYARALNS